MWFRRCQEVLDLGLSFTREALNEFGAGRGIGLPVSGGNYFWSKHGEYSQCNQILVNIDLGEHRFRWTKSVHISNFGEHRFSRDFRRMSESYLEKITLGWVKTYEFSSINWGVMIHFCHAMSASENGRLESANDWHLTIYAVGFIQQCMAPLNPTSKNWGIELDQQKDGISSRADQFQRLSLNRSTSIIP